LEALAAGDTGLALQVLRHQLAPLAGEQHVPRLHHLASQCCCCACVAICVLLHCVIGSARCLWDGDSLH
jgi:hypothetical protein